MLVAGTSAPSRQTGRIFRRGGAGTLRVAMLLAALVLAGCTAVSSSSIDAVKLAIRQHHQPPLTAAEVAARPYYQLEASTPSGHAVLILGNLDGKREDWYGAHGVVVFLEHGQVVRTAGLPQNLDGLQQAADNPFARGLQRLTAPVEYTRYEDWSPGYRYGVPVHVRLTPAGTGQLAILGQTRTVLRVDEQLDAPAAGWHAVNHYWVDPADGFVWKSVQQVTPGLPITLVQLRPYRGASS